MTEFRVFYGTGPTQETDLYDCEVIQSANPFANYAVLYIDDNSGTNFDEYPRGTEVEIEEKEFSEPDTSYTTYFVGYVAERRSKNTQRGDVLEVEVYSFDQFLRNNSVSADQSGNTISTALENVIKDDTAVSWNANNVFVADDQTLDRSYQGENVEEFLRSVARKSANEDFGVENDIEFYFRDNESGQAPRNISNTEWLDYDIPERGKRSINEITVFYDSGSAQVTLQNSSDKLDLQDSLGTSDPVKLAETVSRPNITSRDAAIDVAKQELEQKESTLTGTVTTFGLPNAEPDDIIEIRIDPRGIDGEFRIAENHTRWADDSNQLTIIKKDGYQEDVFVELTRSVKRTSLKDVNRGATEDFVFRPTVEGVLDASGSLINGGLGFTGMKITNYGFQQLRDSYEASNGWGVSQMVVGSGGESLSREDASLDTLEGTTSQVSISFPDFDTVEFSATGFDNTGNELIEVGLQDGNGFLLARALFQPASANTVDIDFRINVSDQPDLDRGYLVEDGQTVVRDILGSNSPDSVASYSVGTGAGVFSTSNTSLFTSTAASSTTESPDDINTAVVKSTIPASNVSGDTLTEGGQLNSGGTLMTHVEFSEKSFNGSNQPIIRERVRFTNGS